MASNAISGVGSKFQRWNGLDWDDIAEVSNIQGPNFSQDVLEYTDEYNDGFKEFLPQENRQGTVSFTLNWTREMYDLLHDDFMSDIKKKYRLVILDNPITPVTIEFDAFIVEL